MGFIYMPCTTAFCGVLLYLCSGLVSLRSLNLDVFGCWKLHSHILFWCWVAFTQGLWLCIVLFGMLFFAWLLQDRIFFWCLVFFMIVGCKSLSLYKWIWFARDTQTLIKAFNNSNCWVVQLYSRSHSQSTQGASRHTLSQHSTSGSHSRWKISLST